MKNINSICKCRVVIVVFVLILLQLLPIACLGSIEPKVYASKQFWFDPAIFFSIAVGLENGSRSWNRSIQADVFLSLNFDLLIKPFDLFASDDEDDEDDDDDDAVDVGTHDDVVAAAAAAAVDPWIFFRKSNVNRFDDDDDCAAALFALFGRHPFAALLKMSNKQSVSLGSVVDISSKSRIVESLTIVFGSFGSVSMLGDFFCARISALFWLDAFPSVDELFDALMSSWKSSCTHKQLVKHKKEK